MLDRRQFLAGAAGITVGFSIAPFQSIAQNSQSLPPMLRQNPLIDSWLHIAADGIVHVLTGRAELGQGVQTALAQIVADELYVGLESIRVETVDTDGSPNEGYTFGSVSVQLGGSALRHAAAFLRQMLLERAAALLDAPVSSLSTADGFVHAGDKGSASYAEIAADLPASVDVGAATPKSVADYTQVGRSVSRVDIPSKVFAEPIFIQDFRPPGVVHARIVKPAAYEARLVELDREQLGDDVDLVVDGSFLAVLNDNEFRAVQDADSVRSAARWSEPVDDFGDDWLDSPKVEAKTVHESGESRVAPARRFDATYGRPLLSHATLSPSMALARYADGQLSVWSHAQGMYPLRGAIAAVVGLDDADVRCVHMQSSGVYGQSGADDAACDAAIIAMARPGTMVRLQYSRADEFRAEPLGSAMRIRLAAETSADGRIQAWDSEISSGPHSIRPGGRAKAGFLESPGMLSTPIPRPAPQPIGLPRGGADRNGIPYYDFGRTKIDLRFIADTPVRVSALRSLGAYGNTFAIESFVDELAAAHEADPFDYRLTHTTDDRARDVLLALRDSCNREWGRATDIGIGFGRYKNSSAYCGVAAEVIVDREQEDIRVARVIAIVDAGLIINPDGVRNQIEGGIVQSVSWTLKEQVSVNGRVRSAVDWATYPILRFSEVPEIHTELIDRKDQPSLGVGEASQGPAAAAIANAIAATTGTRLRQTPLLYTDWAAATGSSA